MYSLPRWQTIVGSQLEQRKEMFEATEAQTIMSMDGQMAQTKRRGRQYLALETKNRDRLFGSAC